MGWLYLMAAIVFEVAGTLAMKASEGFVHLAPAALSLACYLLCLGALTMSINRIELGVVYAVWAGVGTALVALIGIVRYREPADALKIGSLVLIILGVVGLNLRQRKDVGSSGAQPDADHSIQTSPNP